jgi:hypothetical protein
LFRRADRMHQRTTLAARVVRTIAVAAAILALQDRSRAEEGQDRVLAAADSPVRLSAESAVIHLKPASDVSLRDVLASAVAEGRILLVLRDVNAVKPPGVLFTIYLDLPEALSAGEDSEWRVGYLNFFNFQEPGKRGSRSFDVTELLRRLVSTGRLLPNTSVTIRPAGRPAPDAEASVGGAQLIEHRL